MKRKARRGVALFVAALVLCALWVGEAFPQETRDSSRLNRDRPDDVEETVAAVQRLVLSIAPASAEAEAAASPLTYGVLWDSDRAIIAFPPYLLPEPLVATLSDGRTTGASVLASFEEAAIATVVLDPPVDNPPEFREGSSDALRLGARVLCVGPPSWMNASFAEARVSGVSLFNPRIAPYGTLVGLGVESLQVPSGTPVFDLDGRLLGSTVVDANRPLGAVPSVYLCGIDEFRHALTYLLAGRTPERGFLGIRLDTSGSAPGATVTHVVPSGPGAAAGLEVDDLVRAYNGRPIRGAREFARLLGITRPGTEIEIEVARGDRKVVLYPTVKEVPQEQQERLAHLRQQAAGDVPPRLVAPMQLALMLSRVLQTVQSNVAGPAELTFTCDVEDLAIAVGMLTGTDIDMGVGVEGRVTVRVSLADRDASPLNTLLSGIVTAYEDAGFSVADKDDRWMVGVAASGD